MAETDFTDAEEKFFHEGEALERGEPPDEELTDRRPRRPSWRPRLVLMGAGVCVALLVFSLAGGRRPADAVAAMTVAAGPSLPAAPAAEPASAAPIAAPATPDERVQGKVKKSERKHAHRSHGRGKRR